MKRKKYFANVFFNITFCNVVYLQDRIENIYSMALIFAQFGTFEICGTNFCDLHILISSTRKSDRFLDELAQGGSMKLETKI